MTVIVQLWDFRYLNMAYLELNKMEMMWVEAARNRIDLAEAIGMENALRELALDRGQLSRGSVSLKRK